MTPSGFPQWEGMPATPLLCNEQHICEAAGPFRAGKHLYTSYRNCFPSLRHSHNRMLSDSPCGQAVSPKVTAPMTAVHFCRYITWIIIIIYLVQVKNNLCTVCWTCYCWFYWGNSSVFCCLSAYFLQRGNLWPFSVCVPGQPIFLSPAQKIIWADLDRSLRLWKLDLSCGLTFWNHHFVCSHGYIKPVYWPLCEQMWHWLLYSYRM